MKKFLGLMMAIALVGAMVGGCNSAEENTDNNAPATTEGGTDTM